MALQYKFVKSVSTLTGFLELIMSFWSVLKGNLHQCLCSNILSFFRRYRFYESHRGINTTLHKKAPLYMLDDFFHCKDHHFWFVYFVYHQTGRMNENGQRLGILLQCKSCSFKNILWSKRSTQNIMELFYIIKTLASTGFCMYDFVLNSVNITKAFHSADWYRFCCDCEELQ